MNMILSHTTAAKTAAVFVVLISPLFTSFSALAQVEVVESNPIIRPIGQSPGARPVQGVQETGPNNPLDNLYEQIQILQVQVQEQTGLIEELSFELKRLKQQRMDDYVDLDRRISELTQGGLEPSRIADSPSNRSSTSNSTDISSRAANTPTINTANAPASRDETAVYRAANDLISAREWDKAITALQGYLTDFPGGRFESNAYYWLGELYFVKNDLPKARDAFQKVIDLFPDSTKIEASKYKLGRTYFQLGDKAKAQDLLEEVASTNNDSSRQAALFLRENFQ
jgi:tol-pal system protein YbgF